MYQNRVQTKQNQEPYIYTENKQYERSEVYFEQNYIYVENNLR